MPEAVARAEATAAPLRAARANQRSVQEVQEAAAARRPSRRQPSESRAVEQLRRQRPLQRCCSKPRRPQTPASSGAPRVPACASARRRSGVGAAAAAPDLRQEQREAAAALERGAAQRLLDACSAGRGAEGAARRHPRPEAATRQRPRALACPPHTATRPQPSCRPSALETQRSERARSHSPGARSHSPGAQPQLRGRRNGPRAPARRPQTKSGSAPLLPLLDRAWLRQGVEVRARRAAPPLQPHRCGARRHWKH